jgi:SAM-dependent methyltransferase
MSGLVRGNHGNSHARKPQPDFNPGFSYVPFANRKPTQAPLPSNAAGLRMIRNCFKNWTGAGRIWPPVDYELERHRSLGRLGGVVLNAGAGWRDLSHLIDGTLVNQDLTWPNDSRKNIDILSPLHSIPRPAHTFDTVVCIAVLEHVANPDEVVQEFFRVLKTGGLVIASIPFLQPEHKVPTDFQRYTKDGMESLFSRHGFIVVESRALFSVYHTLYWIVDEWLKLKRSLGFRLLRRLLLPPLAAAARRSNLQSEKIASAFQVVARKPDNGIAG